MIQILKQVKVGFKDLPKEIDTWDWLSYLIWKLKYYKIVLMRTLKIKTSKNKNRKSNKN